MVGLRQWAKGMLTGVCGLVIAAALGTGAARTSGQTLDQAQPAQSPTLNTHVVSGDVATSAANLGPAVEPPYSPQRAAFEAKLNFSAFRRLSILHLDQMKIVDSWARQSIYQIRHKQTLDGRDPVAVALDLWMRRPDYADANIIYVESVPVREQLAKLAATQVE
mgnify:CR=1 FL=1